MLIVMQNVYHSDNLLSHVCAAMEAIDLAELRFHPSIYRGQNGEHTLTEPQDANGLRMVAPYVEVKKCLDDKNKMKWLLFPHLRQAERVSLLRQALEKGMLNSTMVYKIYKINAKRLAKLRERGLPSTIIGGRHFYWPRDIARILAAKKRRSNHYSPDGKWEFSLTQALRYLQIGEKRMKQLISDGVFNPEKKNKTKVFRKKELDAYLARNPLPDGDEFLDVDAAAKYIGITPGSLRSYIPRKIGPKPTKRGWRVLFRRSDLDDYLREKKNANTEK